MRWRIAALSAPCLLWLLTASSVARADSTKAIAIRPLDLQQTVAVDAGGRPGEHSAALFVGVNHFKYARGIRPLSYAVDDAIAQAYLFVIQLKLIPAQNCYLALSGDPFSTTSQQQLKELESAKVQRIEADKSSLIDAILNVANARQQKSDMIIVSFSTHGFEYRNEAYVVPSDGRWGDALADTALACKRVEELLRESKAGKRLLFVDACQDRPGNDGGKGIDSTMTSAFLQAFGAAEGQAVLNSCDVGQVSYEDPALGHGVFTNFLLKALDGEARSNKDGFITLGAVSDYVSRSVKDYVVSHKLNVGGPAQNPYFAAPGDARDIPLAIDPGTKAKADEFTVSLKDAIQNLKVKINDDGSDGSYSSELNGKLVRELLSKLKFDDDGQELLASVQSFIKGTTKEKLFVSYIQDLLKRRETALRDANPVDVLQKRSMNGDPDATFRLAQMYASGDGIEKDEQTAMKLLARAADADNIDAMTELGRRYYQEYSTGIDNAEAFRWLKKAADAGDAKAMFYLGTLYAKGRGCNQDLTEAASRYAQAEVKLRDLAKANDPEVMYALGAVLLESDDVNKETEGRQWLQKSADLGDANALVTLGWIYENGSGAPQDDREAFKRYNEAAQRKSAMGMYHLAMMYAAGRGTDKDPVEAIQWYSRAAELGHPSAAFRAGLMYQKGEGVPRNEVTAQSYFQRGFEPLRKAAERGDAVSLMFDLGQCYANGWGLDKKDPELANYWFFKAANRGDAKAAQRLGDIYATGAGVVKDPSMALDWYRRAGLTDVDAKARLASVGARS